MVDYTCQQMNAEIKNVFVICFLIRQTMIHDLPDENGAAVHQGCPKSEYRLLVWRGCLEKIPVPIWWEIMTSCLWLTCVVSPFILF